MFRQRIREWGFFKNIKEKEMKAVLRALRLYWKRGEAPPEIKLRGKPVHPSQLRAFFRKKQSALRTLDELPTPTETETKDVHDMEVIVHREQVSSRMNENDNLTVSEPQLTAGEMQLAEDNAESEIADLHATGLPLRDRRWISYNVDPGPAILPPYFKNTFQQMGNFNVNCRSSHSEAGVHPRNLLIMWRRVMIDNAQGSSSWCRGPMLELLRLVRPLVLNEHPGLIPYLLLLRRLAEFCPIDHVPRPQICSCEPSLGVSHKIIWSRLVSDFVSKAEDLKGFYHPLTIAIGISTSDDIPAEDMFSNVMVTLMNTRGKADPLYESLRSNEKDINYITTPVAFYGNGQIRDYTYRLRIQEWNPATDLNITQITLLPYQQARTDERLSNATPDYVQSVRNSSYAWTQLDYCDKFHFQQAAADLLYFEDSLRLEKVRMPMLRTLIDAWVRMASGFAIQGKDSIFHHHSGNLKQAAKACLLAYNRAALLPYLVVLWMTIPNSSKLTDRLKSLRLRQLEVWTDLMFAMHSDSVSLFGTDDRLGTLLRRIQAYSASPSSMLAFSTVIMDYVARACSHTGVFYFCLRGIMTDAVDISCAFQEGRVDQAVMTFVKWNHQVDWS